MVINYCHNFKLAAAKSFKFMQCAIKSVGPELQVDVDCICICS